MDDDEEDVVCLGSPLEELPEDEVRPRKAPRLEDQIVTDKQGRRRFHGAFTGGFSAGYFNSVGTKEGWTPTAFVSSKGQRSEARQSRPQDFMDDEDLEAFGIAPQGIRPSADFGGGSQQGKRKRVTDSSGPIPGTPVLEELLRPTRDTMGMRLLRRLGWRPGQGVGPRVNRRQKKTQREKQRLAKGAAAAEASDSEGSGSENEALKDVTFAPCDVPELSSVRPKADVFGLGYTPLARTPILGRGAAGLLDPAPLSLTEKKRKLLIQGQAFGVGAYEEEDDDIYATEDMSNYDFGDNKEARDGKAKPGQDSRAVLGLVKAIAGFRLSSQPLQQPKVYPPPHLPPGFVPHHTPRRRRFERKASEVQGLGRHNLTAEHRAHIIAEKPRATVEIRSGVKGQHPPPPPPPPKDCQKTIDTSEVDKLYEEFKNSEKRLGSDFKPFASVPEKQKRYELFLRMKEKGQKDRFYLAQPKAMTEWERQRELQEFSRAAKLFQPLVSSMATRFVTAAGSESDPTLKDGLNVDIPKAEAGGKAGLLNPVVPGDERTAAARSGMFGKLTQTTEDWHPDSLLCRRFNVPNPYPDSSFVGVRKARKGKASLFDDFHTTTEETAGLRTPGHRQEEEQSRQQQQQGEQEQHPGEEEVVEAVQGSERLDDRPEDYGLKVPVDGPPTMDLFKAIFQDSDSDSDSDKESTKSKDEEEHQPLPGSSSLPSTSQSASVQEGRRDREVKDNTESVHTTTTTTTTTATTTARPGQRRGRVSRFEPLSEDIANQQDKEQESHKPTNQPQDISSITFIPRKRDTPSTKPVPVAQGIFANVDLVALNSYRNQRSEEPDKEVKVKHTWPEAVINAGQNKAKDGDSSTSSTDSDDVYGPPAPSYLKNRAQMIQSSPPVPRVAVGEAVAAGRTQGSGWVLKESEGSKSTKKHKHKARSKIRKEKKKKKEKKNKKHKEKKKKDHRSSSRRRRSNNRRDSSSSSSSRSESLSDSS